MENKENPFEEPEHKETEAKENTKEETKEKPNDVEEDKPGKTQKKTQSRWQIGQWNFKIIGKIPSKAIDIKIDNYKKLSYIIEAERKTKKGVIRGQIIVPQEKININEVKPGIIVHVKGAVRPSEKSFVVIAQSVQLKAA